MSVKFNVSDVESRVVAFFAEKGFSWAKFFREIEEAELNPSAENQVKAFTLWKNASRMSGNWNTCACGKLDDGILRLGHEVTGEPMSKWREAIKGNYLGDFDSLYTPVDPMLKHLGVDFHRSIMDERSDMAKELFGAIQERAAHVVLRQKEDGIVVPMD